MNKGNWSLISTCQEKLVPLGYRILYIHLGAQFYCILVRFLALYCLYSLCVTAIKYAILHFVGRSTSDPWACIDERSCVSNQSKRHNHTLADHTCHSHYWLVPAYRNNQGSLSIRSCTRLGRTSDQLPRANPVLFQHL